MNILKAAQKAKSHSWLLLALLALVWGSSFILIKKGLTVYGPGEVGAIRIFSAALFLMPITLHKLKTISRKDKLLLFFSGLLGSFIPAFLFALAQTRLDSSLTGILNALTPLFVLMVGAAFFQQSIKRKESIGLIIGLLGTIVLIVLGNEGSIGKVNFYALFVVGATLCYGINLNIIKKYLAGIKPLMITSISLLLVSPLAGIYLFFMTDFVDKVQYAENAMSALSYLLILGIVGTALALILFNKLVQITSPVFTSFVTYLIPVVAVIWGVLDGEVLVWGHLLGMLSIIGGVYIANRKGKKGVQEVPVANKNN